MHPDLQFSTPRIEAIDCELLQRHDVMLNVLRLDQVHPTIHGNKWFKLKRNLAAIEQSGCKRVVSFGGAYSNHIYALAAAGKIFNLETLGLIRGELSKPLNPVLQFAQDQGMQLIAVSRGDYRRKQQQDFLATLAERFGEFSLLPEGGSNALAVEGCMEIADFIRWGEPQRPRVLAVACGTGATLSGLIRGVAAKPQPAPQVIGVAVLKAHGYLQRETENWLHPHSELILPRWRVVDDYHCGGYAKSNASLHKFIAEFRSWSDVPIEPVYTGKLFYGLFDRVDKGLIPPGTEILAVHSGGIH